MNRNNNTTLRIVLALVLGLPVLGCLGFCGFSAFVGALMPAPPPPPVAHPSPPPPVYVPPDPTPPTPPPAPAAAAPTVATNEEPEAASGSSPRVTQEQIRIAQEFNDELWEHPDDDEDAVRRRVARRLRVRPAEVDEAYLLVISDERLRREMTEAYNASHGFDRRGNRIR